MTTRPMPPWVAEILGCPRCHRPLAEADEKWSCASCGVVGRQTLGFPDFLAGVTSLPVAAGDDIDLARDDAAGRGLAAAAVGQDFTALSKLVAEQQSEAAGRAGWSTWRRQACDRFHANLRAMNADAAPQGGEALLAKVDGKVAELGWPALKGSLALEAAGGAGYFLPAFSRRFGRVVFVDASLSGLVLAQQLAEEQGLDDVAFVRADVTALPFLDRVFDFVHENGVIEHVHDPRRMLAEAVRVRDVGGTYVCVSPNRLSIAREPHFGVPLYGAVPAAVRKRLVPYLRGFEDGVGTDLRSLVRLRRDLAAGLPGDRSTVFFLPRHLPVIALQTPVRRLVRRVLEGRWTGGLVDHLLNVTLLGIMPQHVVIAVSADRASRSR